MDKKKIIKQEPTCRKIEPKKDRGDLKRTIKLISTPLIEYDTNVKTQQPDRGDSVKKTPKTNEVKSQANRKQEKLFSKTPQPNTEETKKLVADKLNLVANKKIEAVKNNDSVTKNVEKILESAVKRNDVERVEKRITKDRSTEKDNKVWNMIKANLEINKVDRSTKKQSDTISDKADSKNSTKGSSHKEPTNTQRKPIIKTITSKNDKTKIYKAVTFVDKTKPKILQVKLPSDYKKISSDTNTVLSRIFNVDVIGTDLKDKLDNLVTKSARKKHKKRRLVSSPDLTRRVNSPPTEVAKWAPSSINKHTKPYYEAWVNTTLAAISKNSKKDKLFYEKQNILLNFQRSLIDRPDTPDLIYENYTDERYTGRIKVKQR